jgi:hypothetical protein
MRTLRTFVSAYVRGSYPFKHPFVESRTGLPSEPA